MRLSVKVDAEVDRALREEYLRGELAVTRAMQGISEAVKQAWRSDVVRAGLGQRLGNTVRSKVYPQREPSINAASFTYTKAPVIIAAHNSGVVIRARNRRWLAIPSAEVPAAPTGRRLRPRDYERATGARLRFIQIAPGKALLVKDNPGGEPKVVFTLVRTVRLPKRLDLLPLAEQVAATAPSRIVEAWKDA